METRERKKRKMSFTTVGGSSILTIFAVLVFVVFALLSLSTSKANASLTNRSTQSVTDYYKADLKAEELLAQLRSGLTPEGVTIYRAETTKNGVKRIVAENVGYTDWDEFASYSVKIDDRQELQVEVLLNQGTDAKYQVIKWKKVYTGEWKADDSMPVFSDESSGMGGIVTIDE